MLRITLPGSGQRPGYISEKLPLGTLLRNALPGSG